MSDLPEDEGPCPDGRHVWKGQRAGGPPDDACSYEWVCYCEVCGVEKNDDNSAPSGEDFPPTTRSDSP